MGSAVEADIVLLHVLVHANRIAKRKSVHATYGEGEPPSLHTPAPPKGKTNLEIVVSDKPTKLYVRADGKEEAFSVSW